MSGSRTDTISGASEHNNAGGEKKTGQFSGATFHQDVPHKLPCW